MGNLTISMAMFHSYVIFPEGVLSFFAFVAGLVFKALSLFLRIPMRGPCHRHCDRLTVGEISQICHWWAHILSHVLSYVYCIYCIYSITVCIYNYIYIYYVIYYVHLYVHIHAHIHIWIQQSIRTSFHTPFSRKRGIMKIGGNSARQAKDFRWVKHCTWPKIDSTVMALWPESYQLYQL